MIVEIALCGAAAALFGRGLYHSGVLTGWIAQGLRQPTPAPSPPPSATPFDHDAYELAPFRATGAWWLDPNRWGDAPPAQPAQPRPAKRRRKGCPKCGSDVAREAWTGDWVCVSLRCDYVERLPQGVPTTTLQRGDEPPRALPCGCEMSSIETRGPLRDGTVFSRCGRCGKWWEPRSDDATHRSLAQDSRVHDKDEMAPHAALAWKRILDRGLGHHGVCPNPECQMPVDKRDGLYYCTDSSCHHAHRGWK